MSALDDARDWARRRTWRRQELDLDGVAERLGDTSLAVVVPALDEEATVGEVVGRIVRELVGPGIVDELVVVDGGSTDATAEVAEAAGAVVVDQTTGPFAHEGLRGKGDSLWIGTASTESELVVFVDADLRGFDPSWVLALVAPMLEEPEVGLVKGYYDRPLEDGGSGTGPGGGRVTELLARPLLNAFWPHLAGVAQPLAGEYAGRRTVLEAVPFVAGYGVEIALLIDVADEFGSDAIAQVDLGVRRHDHQSLRDLGRMAAEILATATHRLALEGRLRDDPTRRLYQPERDADRGLVMVEHPVSHAERPPLGGWRPPT